MRLRDPIVTAMLSPHSVSTLTDAEWDLLVRQGRRTSLLACLAHRLDQAGLLGAVPQAPRHHLKSALLMARRQNAAVRWEVECIRQAMVSADARLTLLKGAAYSMAGLKLAQGRIFSDIDILVPRAALEHTEVSLQIHGWQSAHHDAYDQRYYRRWMHEIPPMRHLRRGTTIDVHHTILPETARVKVNTSALLDAITPLPGNNALYVLPPADMLLHSATHLFHEGDFEKGLRDLFDLDSLLRQFGPQPGFWSALVPRAVALGLTRPLYYALRYTSQLLDTPVPAEVLRAARVGQPAAAGGWFMDWCYARALRPMHASASTWGSWPARFALYVRSHWIRMPLHLLVYHLGRKALMSAKGPDPQDPVANVPAKQAGDTTA